jgi:hypothetical protein
MGMFFLNKVSEGNQRIKKTGIATVSSRIHIGWFFILPFISALRLYIIFFFAETELLIGTLGTKHL